MSPTYIALITASLILHLATHTQASTLFSETFTTDSDGNLGGRSIELSQQGSGTTWSTTGGASTVSNGAAVLDANTGTFAKMSAPFQGNNLSFSLSYDIRFAANDITDGLKHMYTGLGNSANDGASLTDFQLSYGFVFRGNFGTGTSTTVQIGRGPRFAGIDDFSVNWTRDTINDDWLTNVRIDVDASNDIVDFYFNGDYVGQVERSITDIGGLWSKLEVEREVRDAATFDNFQISSTAVPEPSTSFLLAISSLGLVASRRRIN